MVKAKFKIHFVKTILKNEKSSLHSSALIHIEELEAKVEKYEQFIKNGVDGGYIQIPDKIDPAYKTIIELTQPKEKN